jgi:hypothetical protein
VLDFWYAVRALRKAPTFTLIAVATLALGIGANTAVFSLCDALLLRPLPYADAARLVALRSKSLSGAPDGERTSPATIADWQARARSFEAIAGYRWRTIDLTGGSHSERLHGLVVTPEYFTVFGVQHLFGRTFRAEDRGSARRQHIQPHASRTHTTAGSGCRAYGRLFPALDHRLPTRRF